MSICRCWARGTPGRNLAGKCVVLALLVYVISCGHRRLSQVSGERHKQHGKFQRSNQEGFPEDDAGIEPHGDDYNKQR